MDSWTDPAAQADASALSPRFVCRVSGAPVDEVDALVDPRAAELARRLAAAEAALRAGRESVSARLFDAIGAAAEKPARNRLIALKRELYNLRPASPEKVEAALAGVDAETADAARGFAGALREAAALEDALRDAHAEALAAARRRFRDSVTDADFRKGLMISSRALYGKLEGYRAAAAEGTLSGRDEKTERGLLRYYTRMAAKATPFATFCSILPGAFVGEEARGAEPEGAVRFRGDPRAKRSFVRINKFIYGLLSDHLRTRPAVRQAMAVERNPTVQAGEGRLVYLTSVEGREVFQRLADNEVLQLISDRMAGGRRPTLGELVSALSSDPEIDATPEEASAYLDKLLEIGFLRFHTGIREQDADWDIPFRAFLDTVDDEHARIASALLGLLREGIAEYADAPVEERAAVIARVDGAIEETLVSMEVTARLRRDMAFYEDATGEASASMALTPGVRGAFAAWEAWVRATARLGYPRAEQATMRHFFDTFYAEGGEAGVPLLRFYEDFYREHFKAHVEKEGKLRRNPKDPEVKGYDLGNPFGVEFIRSLNAARMRLTEAIRAAWAAEPEAVEVDVSAAAVEEALDGVETVSRVPRSVGAFALLLPASEGAPPRLLTQGSSYTAGYGKYFSRFLYMLPDDLQEEVRRANAALTDELLAEICGDAQFNANLHPPLMRWEISYPTGEGGVTEEQLRSSEIRVERDPEDAHALQLVHAPTGRRVIPVDLGFLNPRMRPPLYQLLSRFTPPVMFAPMIPESPTSPPPAPEPAAEGAEGPGTTDAAAAPAGEAAEPAENAGAVEGSADSSSNKPEDAGTETPAEAAPPPPPTVAYRPRITTGGGRLVLARRRWTVPGALFPARRPDESAADHFVRVNRWRAEHGIPETCYLRVLPQPVPKPGAPAGETPAEAPAEPEIPGYEAAEGEGAEAAGEEAPEAAEAAAPSEGESEREPAADGADSAAKPPARVTQPSRDYYKPQFMDFSSPLLVALLGKLGTGLPAFSVTFEERLPERAGLASHEGASYATELVVQLYFPGGTAGAAGEAPALAGAVPA